MPIEKGLFKKKVDEAATEAFIDEFNTALRRIVADLRKAGSLDELAGDADEIRKFHNWIVNFAKDPKNFYRIIRVGKSAGNAMASYADGAGANGLTLYGEVRWSPNDMTGNRGSKRPPYLGLAHELWHAYDRYTVGDSAYLEFTKQKDEIYYNEAEKRAVRAENWFRLVNPDVELRERY